MMLHSIRRITQITGRQCAFSRSFASSEEHPKPVPTKPSELTFDERTHTGQAWDAADSRLARCTTSPKQVNPNFAIDLIAKVPPTPSNKHVVYCDGGGGPLGHPKVFINLDKPGSHACGYCGLRFYKEGLDDGSEHIQV